MSDNRELMNFLCNRKKIILSRISFCTKFRNYRTRKIPWMIRKKEFHDPETASSSGMFHDPSQSSWISCPRGMISRESCLPRNKRHSIEISGNDFEDLSVPEDSFPSFFKIPRNLTSSPCRVRSDNIESTMRHGEGLRRESQSSTISTPRFNKKYVI